MATLSLTGIGESGCWRGRQAASGYRSGSLRTVPHARLPRLLGSASTSSLASRSCVALSQDSGKRRGKIVTGVSQIIKRSSSDVGAQEAPALATRASQMRKIASDVAGKRTSTEDATRANATAWVSSEATQLSFTRGLTHPIGNGAATSSGQHAQMLVTKGWKRTLFLPLSMSVRNMALVRWIYDEVRKSRGSNLAWHARAHEAAPKSPRLLLVGVLNEVREATKRCLRAYKFIQFTYPGIERGARVRARRDEIRCKLSAIMPRLRAKVLSIHVMMRLLKETRQAQVISSKVECMWESLVASVDCRSGASTHRIYLHYDNLHQYTPRENPNGYPLFDVSVCPSTPPPDDFFGTSLLPVSNTDATQPLVTWAGRNAQCLLPPLPLQSLILPSPTRDAT